MRVSKVTFVQTVFCIAVSVCALNDLQGQKRRLSALYVSTDLHFGNHFGIGLGPTILFDDSYSISFFYTDMFRRPPNFPSDYNSGLSRSILEPLSLTPDKLFNRMQNNQLMVGKIFRGDHKTSRLHVAIGLSYTQTWQSVNWEPVDSYDILPNYTYETKYERTVGLVIMSKFEIPYTRIIGFSLTPMLQLTPNGTYIGLGIGKMFGVLRDKKEK